LLVERPAIFGSKGRRRGWSHKECAEALKKPVSGQMGNSIRVGEFVYRGLCAAKAIRKKDRFKKTEYKVSGEKYRKKGSGEGRDRSGTELLTQLTQSVFHKKYIERQQPPLSEEKRDRGSS